LLVTDEEVKLQTFRDFMWRSGDLRWKLDELQCQIRSTVKGANAKKICVLSSRQIGKSYWSSTYALEYLAKHPNKIARIIAPTLKQCNDIVNDNLARIILDAPAGFILKRKSDYRWEFSNGSSLRMGALERAHVDGNRGGNASLVIYEECGFVEAEDFLYGVNSVLGPQLLRSNGVELFVSSPSEDPDHPLHTQVLPECVSMGTAFRYTVYDSPSITPEMIEEAARRCGGYETDAFKREYLAEIIRPSTLMVIPDYNEHRHVNDFTAPTSCHWHVTIDWGGVRDLTVALLHTYDFIINKWLVWDERMWPANTPSSKILAELQEWEDGFPIHSRWADVPGQLQVDLVEQGYEVQIPAKSDWLASVNNMAVLFSTDKIILHPRCEFLRKSCRAGMFNKTRTDFTRTSVDLGHCDALAALMYAVRMQNTENPYGYEQNRPDSFFFMPKEHEVTDLGEALNPGRFGRYK
jgi:hypothetical protein